MQGRCEVALNNKNYVYLSDRQLSLTECFAQNRYIYPRRLYEGLELFIDLSAAAAPDAYLVRDFALDLRCLPQRWCPDGGTYITGGSPDLQQAFQALGTRDNARSLFARKTAVLTLLEQLCRAPDIPAPQTCTFYTESQVAIAKQTEALITADLARHIPAHALAARFSVSETSLKNYFRGVYGQNLSAYLLELRLKRAVALLAETRLSVAEIAAQVGYANQSKFAKVFREKYGAPPLEYRRTAHLRAFHSPRGAL